MKKLVFFIFIIYSSGFTQPELPQLTNWVTDKTETLSESEKREIARQLVSFEDTTSNQLVVLMIPTLDNYPLETYSFEVAEKNKIGTKENENGILLLIVKEDRKLRIEVGYGLEGALTDALSSSIIRNVIIPFFRKNNYFEGIKAGVSAIISATAGEYSIAAEKRKKKDDNNPFSAIGTIIMILFFIVTSFLRRGRRRRGGGFIYFGGPGGSSGGFGGGGGGSFGGFSGGGGSFGGGGASGSW